MPFLQKLITHPTMLVNIDKPANWTSFDVVKKLRFITKVRKIGHGGTLDPFATGVLVVGIGKDTKKLTEISAGTKSYRAVMTLGSETDTLDPEGTIIRQVPIPDDINEEKIQDIFKQFRGIYLQTPPMYSAKKIKGQRLYELARKQVEIEREPIALEIYSLDLVAFAENKITFDVSCSKGTYIRVLASDIAGKLGTCGYLTNLTRTRVGEYSLDDSLSLEEFENTWSSIAI